MTCEEVQKMMLQDETTDEVESHVSTCVECAQYRKTLKLLADAAPAYAEPSREVDDAVRRQAAIVMRRQRQAAAMRFEWRCVVRSAVVAACLAVLAVPLALTLRNHGASRPGAEESGDTMMAEIIREWNEDMAALEEATAGWLEVPGSVEAEMFAGCAEVEAALTRLGNGGMATVADDVAARPSADDASDDGVRFLDSAGVVRELHNLELMVYSL